MIRETLIAEHQPAITSDRWHVVLAQWSGAPGEPSFLRSIVSEHADTASAVRAARALQSTLAPEMARRPRLVRDQVLVRRPRSESLKRGRRVVRRRK